MELDLGGSKVGLLIERDLWLAYGRSRYHQLRQQYLACGDSPKRANGQWVGIQDPESHVATILPR